MCPLRIILIFLSATLAGFFVIRGFKSPADADDGEINCSEEKEIEPSNSVPFCSKVSGAIGKGFWTLLDMASGRYLWRNLVSSSAKKAD